MPNACSLDGWSIDNRSIVPGGVFDAKGKGKGSTDTLTGTSAFIGGKATVVTTEGDITVTGSNIVANGDTVISAARNLTLQSGQDTAANDNHSNSKAIGKVVISDTERFAGYYAQKHNDNQTSITQIDANVARLQGNVTLAAGDTYTQSASNVLAANDIAISGKTVDITTAANTSGSAQDSSDVKVGTFARISSPVIDLANNIEAASKSDGRLQTMQRMATAANAYQAASAINGNGILIKAEIGVGIATAKSQDHTSGNQAQLGQYWTTAKPAGPLQEQIDLALKPEWGNTATQITVIKVPAGQTIYQGAAASQGGAQIGGGSQIFIQHVDPSWVIR